MKKITQKFTVVLMMATLAIVANAMPNDERVTLRNGKGKSNVSLNPSRTYTVIINGKQFRKLKIAIETSSNKIHIQIKSPNSRTLTSGIRKNFEINNVGAGDYKIIITNKGKRDASAILKFDGIDGESKD